ncbi:MAG: ion transporter [Lachnospiraceae bacterium]|nr:ion transporter [Lachnospiraceae bacterium]
MKRIKRRYVLKKSVRKRLFEIIEVANDDDNISKVYDIFMIITIISSLIPIATKGEGIYSGIIDKVTVTIFLIDYAFRFITADFKLNEGNISFGLYCFTPMAIIDIISILPSIITISNAFRLFKILRLFRTFRVFRVFKAIRYSKNITIIFNVLKKQKESLIVVGCLAIGYILVSALIIISVEPDTFNNYFDAIYWATVSLTTVGYGDIYAVSVIGKIITMISAFLGIAVVALPAGIVTAGYMNVMIMENVEFRC